MKHFDYSTADGQKRLMRESVGQPDDFGRSVHSGFSAGEILEHVDLNLRHPITNVEYIRDGKPEGGSAVIVVKHQRGHAGEWLARDFRRIKR